MTNDAGEWQALCGKTFVQSVEFHRSLPSTNDLALQRVREAQLVGPHLILAEEQTAGRGRGANQWWSGPGALTFSLILEPQALGIPQSAWPRIALTAGLSLCEVLDDLVPHAVSLLKWPNDVLLERRKVCGILVEVPACAAPLPQRLVVGMGINLNNSLANAPEEIRQRGTSVCDIARRTLDAPQFLATLLQRFAGNLSDLVSNPELLAERWQAVCALNGKIVTVDQSSQVVSGRCLGLASDGALLLNTSRGTEAVYTGVVTAITDSL